MKKIVVLLLGAAFLVSCGRNKEEQMLYDYQQENVKAMNFNLDDLEFDIENIEKVADITAADSAKEVKHEFAVYWKNNPDPKLVDTLRFEYVKQVLNEAMKQQDTLQKLYQEAVLTAIRIDDYSYELESKQKRDKAMDEYYSYKKTLITIEGLEKRYTALTKKPDSVLSVKYAATYSLKNPMLGNTKQTFNKVFYTNAAQTKFVKEETTDSK